MSEANLIWRLFLFTSKPTPSHSCDLWYEKSASHDQCCPTKLTSKLRRARFLQVIGSCLSPSVNPDFFANYPLIINLSNSNSINVLRLKSNGIPVKTPWTSSCLNICIFHRMNLIITKQFFTFLKKVFYSEFQGFRSLLASQLFLSQF